MIKRLQKKLTLLLGILIGSIWIMVLFAFNLSNYKGNLMEYKNDIHAEIREIGWDNFLASDGEAIDWGDAEYAIMQISDDHTITLLNNHFLTLSEKQLLSYGQQLMNPKTTSSRFLRVTYASRWQPDGKIYVLLSGRPAFESSFSIILGSIVLGILGILALIAATKTLTQWLVRPIEEMIDNEERFISNASHELKTPLAVISANTELLLADEKDNKHLQYIQQETKRMNTLANKMLTLVRLEAPYNETEWKKCFISEALLDIIYPMEHIAYEKKLKLELNIQEDMYLMGCESQLQTVMSTLLDNAISYTPQGGRIQIDAYIQSKKFHLKVSNTGDPIPKEMQDQLFERFFRRDEAREDTDHHFGLGLSIAHSIVSNHHGKITVNSVDGVNVFTVALPVNNKK